MEDPVDDVVFSKRLRQPKGSTDLFKEDAKFIHLPPPPANSSLDTANDLLAVQGATFLRQEDMDRSIKKHDKDPAFSVKIYMSLFGLEYDEKYINQVLDESTIFIRSLKNKFNRPRPVQLGPYFGITLKLSKSRTAKTPSYPSGHTTQSRLIAEIYGAMYPDHRKNLLKASEECGAGRIIAGLHFPQDHAAGIYLAKRLFKSLKTTKKTNYDQSIDLTPKKRRKE